MQKALLIQFGIFSLIVIIVIFSYKFFFKNNNFEKNLLKKENIVIKEDVSNKIQELEYIASDEDGNTYKILSIEKSNNNKTKTDTIKKDIDPSKLLSKILNLPK